MNSKEIKNINSRVATLTANGEIHDALATLRDFANANRWLDLLSRVDALAVNYSYLLSYFAGGSDDPARADLIADLKSRIRALCDIMCRRALMIDQPALYFNTARNCSVRPDETIASLIDAYAAEERRLADDFESIADPGRRRRAESLLSDLFARIWTTHPLSDEDSAALQALFAGQHRSPVAAALAVSALTLGLLEYYDPKRFRLLLKAYGAADDDISMRALTGFLIAAFRYRRRPMPADVANMLAAARETSHWAADFKDIAVELLRARDTERISRKMREDVYPTLMQLQNGLKDKIGRGELDLEALAEGENPEWEEMLNRDGVADKLRELTEIQADGGDVFMASFAHLKRFPFFNDIANWFAPFDRDHSEVARIDGLDGLVGDLISDLSVLCDSDKYSIVLAMATMPEEQRKLALESMRMQVEQVREMGGILADASDRRALRRRAANKYIQNLYRFYNIFRRKGEFFDPFGHGINILDVDSVAADFNDAETLEVIGEFSFRHKLWAEAARILTRLDSMSAPDAARSQKIGFCYESMGQFSDALTRYEEAEMLDGASQWTLRHLASVWRSTGHPEMALNYYRRLSEMLPDDFATTLNLAYTLTEADRMAEAEAQYHKALYFDPQSVKARRGLAWTQFINGKLDEAVDSYSFVIGSDAHPADYLNAGHVARAQGRVREALNFYKLSMISAGHTHRQLFDTLEADKEWLHRAGVDPAANRLFIEAIKTLD